MPDDAFPGVLSERSKARSLPLILGDETVKIFLSTCGKPEDISKDLKAFLEYVEHSTDEVAERSGSELVKAAVLRMYVRGRNEEEIAGDLGISREQAAAWIREA